MIDPANIGLAYQSVSFIRDSLKAMQGYKVDVEVSTRVQDALARVDQLQDSLFITREELYRLQDENRLLRDAAAAAAEWRDVSSRYKLVQTAEGGIVRESRGIPDEPDHYACPNCFTDQTLVILQPPGKHGNSSVCARCKGSFTVQRAEPISYRGFADV